MNYRHAESMNAQELCELYFSKVLSQRHLALIEPPGAGLAGSLLSQTKQTNISLHDLINDMPELLVLVCFVRKISSYIYSELLIAQLNKFHTLLSFIDSSFNYTLNCIILLCISLRSPVRAAHVSRREVGDVTIFCQQVV